MTKSAIFFALLFFGFSAFADDSLNCTVESKLGTQSVQVAKNQEASDLDVGDGHSVSILNFGKDVRITLKRPPTAEERRVIEDEDENEDGAYLESIILAYSQTKSADVVTYARLMTSDVDVICSSGTLAK